MINSLKWLMSLLLWVYIILRAFHVDITHDEAYSFLLVKTNYFVAMVGTANTHWLNSLGMKLGSFFGNDPWLLRLFSVLAWPVYAISGIQLSKMIQNKLLGLAFFVGLVANPFLLDFFSLARGYGLACAFTLAAIWRAVDLVHKQDWAAQSWVPSVFLAALAVASNYTTFYFFLSLIGAFALSQLVSGRLRLLWPPSKNPQLWLLVVGVSVIATSNLLFIKLYTGDLEFGGPELVSSLFGSLIEGSLYNVKNSGLVQVLSYALVAVLLLGFVYAFVLYKRSKSVSPFVFVACILLLMLLLNILFHLFLGAPYLNSRTTLVFYPCIVTTLFLFLNEWKPGTAVQKGLGVGIGLPLLLLAGLHLYRTANLKYCYEWKDQAETKEALEVLLTDHPQKVLVHQWHFGVLVNYYQFLQPQKYSFQARLFTSESLMDTSSAVYTDIGQYSHALLLPPYDLQKLQQKGVHYTIVKQFPVTGAVVLRFQKQRSSL